MDFTIQTKITFTEDRIASTLIGAFEGGSGYWVEYVTRVPYRNVVPNDIMSDFELVLPVTVKPDDTDQPEIELTREKLQTALELMASNPDYAYEWRCMMEDNDDANVSDNFLQLALFGEVVYA